MKKLLTATLALALTFTLGCEEKAGEKASAELTAKEIISKFPLCENLT